MTKARLLKHDFPVHGILANLHSGKSRRPSSLHVLNMIHCLLVIAITRQSSIWRATKPDIAHLEGNQTGHCCVILEQSQGSALEWAMLAEALCE